MSNFNNTTVNGDHAQLGDHNTQNHTTQHNHVHYHDTNSKRKPLEPGEIFAIGAGGLVAFSAIVYAYFKHTQQVFLYIDLAIISSPLLGLLAMIILVSSDRVYNKDLNNILSVAFLGLVAFGLSYFLRHSTPESVIDLTSRTNPLSFIGAFNGNERIGTMAGSNFVGALLLIVCSLALHIMSYRQLCYSLSGTKQQGFWFNQYISMPFFEVSQSYRSMVVVCLSVLGCACWSGQYHLLLIT